MVPQAPRSTQAIGISILLFRILAALLVIIQSLSPCGIIGLVVAPTALGIDLSRDVKLLTRASLAENRNERADGDSSGERNQNFFDVMEVH